ncbi:hypothetical protein FA15DRAFT_672468 [Coprinopsis marcescibilis]|uniref:EKC/KEOPS complex subunit GON7 n=1 Tax=Coprinopsis marcescibilis TaxID=230819 RepID=A0A5C3KNS1_COPMA|nr:hypothetical protein FA15DRAFT_672468 [Coprinopsis marcescibilis]
MASITINYQLNPPSDTDKSGLETSRTHTFAIPGAESVNESNPSEWKAYYAALQTAIADARNTVGDELTAWRDRVGKSELGKEPKGKDADDDVDEEGDEEEA